MIMRRLQVEATRRGEPACEQVDLCLAAGGPKHAVGVRRPFAAAHMVGACRQQRLQRQGPASREAGGISGESCFRNKLLKRLCLVAACCIASDASRTSGGRAEVES